MKATKGLLASGIAALALLLTACPGPISGTTPTITSFTANPPTLTAGETSTLEWVVTGDAPITLSIDNGVGPVTGTSATVEPSVTTTYTLTAKNAAGEATRQATVTLNPAPESTIDLVVGTYNFGALLEETLTALSFYFNLEEDDLPDEDVTLRVTGPTDWNGGDVLELTVSPEEVASGWIWSFAPTAIVSGEYRLEAEILGESYTSSSSPDIAQLLPVPQNVAATSFDETMVSGAWDAAAGAKSYRPTLYDAPVRLDAEIFSSALTTETSIALDGLELASGEYFLGVLAFNIDRTVAGQPEKPAQFNVSVAVSETFVVGGGSESCADPVAIPDANLQQAIRNMLGKPTGDITCTDMESLTELEANERGISNLEGLQFADNLIGLELDDNTISDISALEDLTELQYLFLQRNNVSDVSPLAGLTRLVALIMNDNTIADLSPLANLADMQYLYVSDNPVGSLAVVENYPGLLELGAARAGVTDLSSLMGKALTYLWLNGNETLEDFSVLSGMNTLEALLVGGTGFGDEEMPLLATMTALKRLQLWTNDVSDISVVANLELEELDIGGTDVRNLSPLHDRTGIITFTAYGLELENADIDFLRDFMQLESLRLEGNHLTDISALVENMGIGDGDVLNVSNNLLNLSDASVQADIQALLDRGVNLTYEPQQ